MFNKLVISTNERRKGRIAKFFCGTTAIYAIVIAGVLALSVVISNPRLADTGERMLTLLTPPPPPAPPPSRQRETVPPPSERRNTLAPPTDLDKVIAAPAPVRHPPTTEMAFNSGDYVPGGGEPISGAFVPGGHGGDDTAVPPPPQPVEPTRPTRPPQVDTTRPVRLPSSVLQGKAVVRRTPNYPPIARQVRLAGSVSVEVMIALDGHVEAARAINGHPLLVAAALDAAREWRFEPTLLNGSPVRVSGVIVFNFTMQ